jgi:hypothetical protein
MADTDDAPGTAMSVAALDYAGPSIGRAFPGFPLNRWLLTLAGACLILSGASFWVVCANANDEPYFGTISKSQAVGQVGFGCVLIALWVCWCVALVALAFRRKVHFAWCIAMLWAALVILVLVECVDGYLSDVITFQATPSLWGGWQRPPVPATAPSASPRGHRSRSVR